MQPDPLPLKDIHLPDAIGWWPPAIGWWLLLILIPLMLWFFIWLYKRITAKTAVKTAKKLLQSVREDSSQCVVEKIATLSTILRRVAISISPRQKTAALTGEAWLQYLDQALKDSPFSQGIGRILIEAPYRKPADVEIDIEQLISLCERWLKAQKKYKP